MEIQPACFINIILAVIALAFYYRGSFDFYLNRPTFLWYLGLAIFIDLTTAILGSFKITPTTTLPGSEHVPWQSVFFNLHVLLATTGFFGFIFIFILVLIRGKNLPYTHLRKFQFKILLPAWLTGESIALLNSLSKMFLKIRLYDFF